MAQYDVFVNPNPASRDLVPFLVDVQSRLLDRLNTRLAMPLRRMELDPTGLPKRLMPRLFVNGEWLVLYAHQAAVVESRLLKQPVASVAPAAHEILAALDTVISGV